ncbi:MAG: hypothetical protein LBE18_10370 [Planctomycetaceae bacterium]|nr:hypothetical protein [Planctomycetaceae bacterium]
MPNPANSTSTLNSVNRLRCSYYKFKAIKKLVFFDTFFQIDLKYVMLLCFYFCEFIVHAVSLLFDIVV